MPLENQATEGQVSESSQSTQDIEVGNDSSEFDFSEIAHTEDYSAITEKILGKMNGKENQPVKKEFSPKKMPQDNMSAEDILSSMSDESATEGDEQVETEDELDFIDEDGELKEDNQAKTEKEMEIVHNGQVVKIPSDKIKEFASKGYDYTQKTQKHAEEVAAFSKQKETYEKELDSQVSQLESYKKNFDQQIELAEKWGGFLDLVKETSPSLFEEIQSNFKQYNAQFENPVVRRQFEQQQKRIEELTGRLDQHDHANIRNEYQTQLKQVKDTYGDNFAKLGIKINWDTVKNAYANGAQDVKTALFAVYGADIQNAWQSKNKLSDVQKKVANQSKVPTAGNVKKTVKVSSQKDLGSTGWNDITRGVLANILNK